MPLGSHSQPYFTLNDRLHQERDEEEKEKSLDARVALERHGHYVKDGLELFMPASQARADACTPHQRLLD